MQIMLLPPRGVPGRAVTLAVGQIPAGIVFVLPNDMVAVAVLVPVEWWPV